MAQMVKNAPAMQETWVQSLGGEDPLEKGIATHSSILTWRISWTEEPGRLQSMGSQTVGHDFQIGKGVRQGCILSPCLFNLYSEFSSVAQSCPTLCNPMDCSPLGSSIHWIFQVGILEWVAISSPKAVSQPRDRTHVSCASCISRCIFYYLATQETVV